MVDGLESATYLGQTSVDGTLCDHIAFINHGEIVARGTSRELSETYGVSSLEDAYLALVGRKELSRAHAMVDVP